MSKKAPKTVKPVVEKTIAAKPEKALKTTKTTAKPTKKAEKKAAPKAEKKPVEKKATKVEDKSGLTDAQVKTLAALKVTAGGGKELTRQDLREKTGINKGWSKRLGAATKTEEDWRDGSLEGMGLIKSRPNDEGRGLLYTITAKGLKALANAKA